MKYQFEKTIILRVFCIPGKVLGVVKYGKIQVPDRKMETHRHPWKCSKPGWMGLWAAWSSETVQAQGSELWSLKALSNPDCSMTDSMAKLIKLGKKN